MRISDWSSDVCSSDLQAPALDAVAVLRRDDAVTVIAEVKRSSPSKGPLADIPEIGRASCRERVCQLRVDLGGRRIIKKKNKKRNAVNRSSQLEQYTLC